MSSFIGTPTLLVNFSGFREELTAAVPLDNKATFSLLTVVVCRLRELSKFFIAFFTYAKDAFFRKIVLSFEIVIFGKVNT